MSANKHNNLPTEYTSACDEMLNSYICINLRRISRQVTIEYNEILKPTGLRTTQIAVLAAIGARPQSSLTEIASDLNMDISTLTRAVSILENKGYAVCQSAGGRKKCVSLTPDGRMVMRKACAFWKDAQAQFKRKVGEEAWQDFHGIFHEYLGRVKAAQKRRWTPIKPLS